MPQHEQLFANEDVVASQRRVTPQELTKALATIESIKEEDARRQEEEERYLAGTLSIGQAIEDLCLDSTPEEIWAEIKTQRDEGSGDKESVTTQEVFAQEVPEEDSEKLDWQREQLADSRTEQERQNQAFAWKTVATLSAPIVAFIAFICILNNDHRAADLRWQTFSQSSSNTLQQDMKPFSRVIATLDQNFYRKLHLSTGPHPKYQIVMAHIGPPYFPGFPPNGDTRLADSEPLYPLRAIPDGYNVYANPNLMDELSEPFGAAYIYFRDTTEPESYPVNSTEIWHSPSAASHVTLTRYAGQIYLRCWIAKTSVSAALHGHSLTLYLNPDAASIPRSTRLVPLTVPLESINSLIPRLTSLIGRDAEDEVLMRSQERQSGGNQNCLEIAEGARLALDSHAWENFPSMTLPTYIPPTWSQTPRIFSGFASGVGGTDPTLAYIYAELDASSNARKISEIPDDQIFHASGATLQKIMRVTTPDAPGNQTHLPAISIPDIWIDARPSLFRPYTFIKHEGSLYLCGWVASRIAQSRLSNQAINVYGDGTNPDLGYSPTQVQLRMDKCHIGGPIMMGGIFISGPDDWIPGTYLMVKLTDVHLDRHAWEKW